MRIETKTVALPDACLEIKASDGEPVVVSGLASKFNGVDSYDDTILPGAYAKTIGAWSARPWPLPMLWNHNPDSLVGRWTDLREDDRGLVVTGELTPGHSKAADVAASLRHGALTGISIGFRAAQAEMAPDGRRLLKEIELFEVSLVTMPADQYARVSGIKSQAADFDDIRQFEVLLREAHGFSRRDARLIAEKGFRAFLTARDEREGDAPSTLQAVRDEQGLGQRDQQVERRDAGSAEVATLLAALREWRLPTSI